MKEIKGISAAPGVAIAPAFLYFDDEALEIPRYLVEELAIQKELLRFADARETAIAEVTELRDRAAREMGDEHAKIFEAHLLMLSDEELHEQIKERLESLQHNIEWVVWDLARELTQKLSGAADPYLRERAIDIHDVARRILNNLLYINKISLAELTEDVILVTRNLLPSDTLTMNKTHVKGIVMDVGGATSHTAILARAFQIPAVLGLSDASRTITEGSTVIVDGMAGRVIVDPDEATVERYAKLASRLKKNAHALLAEKDMPAETTDGYLVTLKANIELPDEAGPALLYGAEGIGLYRSEFLFLTPGKTADEEEQYDSYHRVMLAMKGRPVTIRTLDVGGDKIIPDLQSTEEKNPLLGWRAIRFCLARRELFKTQLRALLRASVAGDLRIMFPMISGLEELEDTLAVLEEAKAECRAKGQSYSESLKVGIMIEVPSAAMTSDILAEKSDFFSIGTNDLVQYSIAADRGNERVAYLAQPFHPAVLRFIKLSIDAAHERGISAAMCGELAGDPNASAILLGLGLDEFSMSAPSIPLVKRVIRGSSATECRELAKKAFTLKSYREVEALVRSWMDERFPAV
ncbi:phosphoenolpyruvate--protein phosphotransferase [Treponema sp.]